MDRSFGDPDQGFEFAHVSICDTDEDLIPPPYDRIGPQVDTNRKTLRFATADFKSSVVFWAFNQAIHHKPVCEIRFFVGAQTISGVEVIAFQPVYCIDLAVMVKTDDVLFV